MDMKPEDRELIDRHLLGRASAEDVAALEARLLEDPGLRRAYLQAAMAEADLRSLALQGGEGDDTGTPKRSPYRLVFPLAAAAAACLAIVGLTTVLLASSPRTVGTIVSSEDAGWQSAQPTTPGARIGPGEYFLKAGVATIAFDSGAEMVLEAPAKFEVVSEMRIVFDHGNAAFHCPESAAGFQVETRFGRVVDHGTRFTLQAPEGDQAVTLDVEEGEVSLQHPGGTTRRLRAKESARMDSQGLGQAADPLAEGRLASHESVITLTTGGRETSVVYNNDRAGRLDPRFLMVKRQKKSNHVDRRALFAFDVSAIDRDRIESVRLILNVVPTGLGIRAGMPKKSWFRVYGIPDDSREDWSTEGLLWEDAPTPEDEESKVVAWFKLKRSKKRAVIELDTPRLLSFVRSDRSGQVGFLIECRTPGKTLVHGFASSRHREAVGPMLEITLKAP